MKVDRCTNITGVKENCKSEDEILVLLLKMSVKLY